MGEHTPIRNLRVEDALWEAARAKAEAEGTTLSAVIRAALARYVARPVTPHAPRRG